MKTINFLTSHFLPENTACTNRVLSFVTELAKSYKVNVIALTEKGIIQHNQKVSYSENITIYYVNQKQFNGKNFFIRAFYEVVYIRKLIKLSKNNISNMVIATSPYMFMIPLVGFFVRSPKVLDIRDLVWEYLDEKSLFKRVIKSTLKFIMKQGINQFEQITVTNEYEKKLLEDIYNIKNVNILFNGIEKSKFETLSEINKMENMNYTVTYVGNIGLAQNIFTLIEAAKLLPEVQFLVIGTGIELEDIKQYIEIHNIQNVKLLGKVDWNSLKEHYTKTSILYAQLDEKYISAVPSKLYEYASIGLPIIYGGVGAAVTFAHKLENTTIIPPNKVEELEKAILEKKNLIIEISQKNRLLIQKNYLREDSSKEIVSIVNDIINNKYKGE